MLFFKANIGSNSERGRELTGVRELDAKLPITTILQGRKKSCLKRTENRQRLCTEKAVLQEETHNSERGMNKPGYFFCHLLTERLACFNQTTLLRDIQLGSWPFPNPAHKTSVFEACRDSSENSLLLHFMQSMSSLARQGVKNKMK